MEVKTNPFYELRNRLYASAAAGCALIAEDFRLKRALEGFKPMSEANKVFGKLYAMCDALISSADPASDIIDCIALADALAVTQGTFADDSDTFEPVPVNFIKPSHLTYNQTEMYREKIRKIPYGSQELDEDFYKSIPDPRLLYQFMEITGKNGGDIAHMLLEAYTIYGDDFISVLFGALDTANKNATGNQLRFISYVTKDEYNEQFIKYAEDEEMPQGIRIAALEAMQYKPENADILETVYKTSKGKVKNAALLSLAKMNAPAAEAPIKKMADKPKAAHYEFLCASGGEAATEYAIKENLYILEHGINNKDTAHPFWMGYTKLLENKKNITDILGKIAENRAKGTVCSVPRYGNSSGLGEILVHDLLNHDDEEYRTMTKELYEKYPVIFFYPRFLLQLMEDPTDSIKKMNANHRQNDGTIASFLELLFTTPDGWYRIKNERSLSEGDYTNVKLFKSIPDDILDFITDPAEAYSADELEKLFPNGTQRQHVMDDMKQKCSLFFKLVKTCQPCDREKVNAAVERFAWGMIQNYPSDEAMRLLPLVSTKSMEGIAFRYALISMQKYNSAIWRYHLRGFNLPEEVVINDMKKMKKYLEEHPDFNNELRMTAVKDILEAYGVKE